MLRRLTFGELLAAAYITLFTGSVFAGVLYQLGTYLNIVVGYGLGLAVAVLLVRFMRWWTCRTPSNNAEAEP